MFLTTGPASVLTFQAFVHEVAPSPTLHTLDGFLFLLHWSNQAAAYAQSILDQLIGNIHQSDGQDCMCMGLTCPPVCCWFDLSCLADNASWEGVSFLDFSEMQLVFWLKG